MDDIKQAVSRLAQQIMSRHPGMEDVVFVGILPKGFPIAQRVAYLIHQTLSVEVPVGQLDATLYRDDLSNERYVTVHHSDIPFSFNQKTVVLICDTLRAGRMAFAALEELFDLGRPACVELAALIDLGGRKLPIQPDYVGLSLATPIPDQQHIHLKLYEIDGEDLVSVEETACSRGD